MARTEFFYKLSDKLDELFPKGDKRRGDALVLNAFANIYLEEENPKGHFVMSPYLVESHRVKNKWWKELKWWIQERFGSAKYLGTPTPVTPEAKRHMKQVHKDRGYLQRWAINHEMVSGDKDIKDFEYYCNHPDMEGKEIIEAFDEDMNPLEMNKRFGYTVVTIPLLSSKKDTVFYLRVKKVHKEKGVPQDWVDRLEYEEKLMESMETSTVLGKIHKEKGRIGGVK